MRGQMPQLVLTNDSEEDEIVGIQEWKSDVIDEFLSAKLAKDQ